MKILQQNIIHVIVCILVLHSKVKHLTLRLSYTAHLCASIAYG